MATDDFTTAEHIARARLLGFTGYNKHARVYFSHTTTEPFTYVDCETLEPVDYQEYWDRLEEFYADEAKR